MIESRYDGDISASNATKRIQKHMKSRDPHVVVLALTLLETTVKNCSFPTILSIGTKSFLTTLKDLCRGNKGPQIQQQALDLVQKLGIADVYKSTVPQFFEIFEELVREGAVFPELDTKGVPLFLPSRSDSTKSDGSGSIKGEQEVDPYLAMALRQSSQDYHNQLHGGGGGGGAVVDVVSSSSSTTVSSAGGDRQEGKSAEERVISGGSGGGNGGSSSSGGGVTSSTLQAQQTVTPVHLDTLKRELNHVRQKLSKYREYVRIQGTDKFDREAFIELRTFLIQCRSRLGDLVQYETRRSGVMGEVLMGECLEMHQQLLNIVGGGSGG